MLSLTLYSTLIPQNVFSFSMSALDEAIRLCRAEELKLTQTIRQHDDLLRSMKTRVKVSSEAEPATSLKDNDIPLKERQEVELLEQVLKKALKIRSSSAVGSTFQKKICSRGSARKAPSVNDCDKIKSSSSAELKGSRQRAGQLKSTAGCGDNPTHSASRQTIKGTHSVRTSCLAQEKTPQCEASAPKQQWGPSASLPLWQSQQAKKNKLWNKVLTRHSQPVPERDHFKKKLVGTFPTDWATAHIAAMKAELDVLTQLGLDLTYCYNAEFQRHQTGCPEPSTEKEYESLLMLRGLEKMIVQVIKEADHLKKDWESKMAWWHGALCPLRSRVEWHHLPQPFLPPILPYSNKGELEDLHSLRLQVAELKLEIHMHQAMCDKLLDLISCDSSSSGHLSATALRGVYSLLGEGGAQFPSLVLDIDSNQTWKMT